MKKSIDDFDWNVDPFTTAHNMKTLLNSTGPGFCLAKFRQTTLHLGIGKVHACHHPNAHKINLTDLEKNPNVLFNTNELKQARTEMLNGKRPAECTYCWRKEDSSYADLSDRHWKSAEYWARPDHDTIAKLTGNEDIYPSYLELSFSNACNLACIYCSPEFSSKWVEVINYKGELRLLSNTPYELNFNSGGNINGSIVKHKKPYVDAFWKWFPGAIHHLSVLRLTGGEPLLHKETFDMLDFLTNNDYTLSQFSVNSNFSVTDKIWDMFIDKIVKLKASNKIKKIILYTSVEAWGDKAEYIRKELNFNRLLDRITQCLSLGINVTIMATINMLSLSSYKELLIWSLSQKKHFNSTDTSNMLFTIDTKCISNPTFLDATYGSAELFDMFADCVSFTKENLVNNSHDGFELYEHDQIERIYRRFLESTIKDGNIIRARFIDYIDKIDSYYNKKFLDIFPEYCNFYNQCNLERNELLKGS